jgi:hypothetical protein
MDKMHRPSTFATAAHTHYIKVEKESKREKYSYLEWPSDGGMCQDDELMIKQDLVSFNFL